MKEIAKKQGGGLDLKLLEFKLNAALKKETKRSLNKWLNKKRNNC